MVFPSNRWINSIHEGHAKTVLATLPSESVNCIITSPPYYLQRDYSTPIQIGNEGSPSEYTENLRLVFSECYRILKDEGTLWLNIGDKYCDGQLLGLPWRVALALKDDGWVLRSVAQTRPS